MTAVDGEWLAATRALVSGDDRRRRRPTARPRSRGLTPRCARDGRPRRADHPTDRLAHRRVRHDDGRGIVGSDVAPRDLGVRFEVGVGEQPHLLGASTVTTTNSLSSRSPGMTARPSSPSTSERSALRRPGAAAARQVPRTPRTSTPQRCSACRGSRPSPWPAGSGPGHEPSARRLPAGGLHVGGVVARLAPHEVVFSDHAATAMNSWFTSPPI